VNDAEIERIYKSALDVSHYAWLRAVFDTGYLLGTGVSTATAQTPDLSATVTVTQAVAADPAAASDPNLAQP